MVKVNLLKNGNHIKNNEKHAEVITNSFGNGTPSWLARRSAPLLARQIMPKVGFNWIASDFYALNTWLMLLNNEQEGIEALKLYFERANRMLDEFKLHDDFFLMPIDNCSRGTA